MVRKNAEENISKADLLFYIRNAHFAVRSSINELISIQAEFEWQDEDEIEILDTEYENKHRHFDAEIAQIKLLDLGKNYYVFYAVTSYHSSHDSKYFKKITYAVR